MTVTTCLDGCPSLVVWKGQKLAESVSTDRSVRRVTSAAFATYIDLA